jgi:hypothetical protein
MLQANDGGEGAFLKLFHRFNETSPPYPDFYGDMFRMLFRPSPPVSKLIVRHMRENSLFPGNYSAAQYRAYYQYETKKSRLPPSEVRSHAQNAVRCARRLLPNHTIYFSSDAALAERLAAEYGRSHSYPVALQRRPGPPVGASSSKEPLHLDRDSRGTRAATSPPPAAFYDVFVDLWIMGNARCVTHGIGGFGRWARLLSHDPRCSSKHSYGRKLYRCSTRL